MLLEFCPVGRDECVHCDTLDDGVVDLQTRHRVVNECLELVVSIDGHLFEWIASYNTPCEMVPCVGSRMGTSLTRGDAALKP